jgi:hypothetical protein
MPAACDTALLEELDAPGIEKFLERANAVAFARSRLVGCVSVIQ